MSDPKPCHLCGGKGYIELPLAERGDPAPPMHPDRVRWFVYGCALGLPALESGKKRQGPPQRAQ